MSAPPRPSILTRVSAWSGYLLAMGGAFLFASKGIWIKLAYAYHVDASALMAIRLALATPVFVIFGLLTWWHRRRTGRDDLPRLLDRPGLYLKALGVGVLGYWLAAYSDFASLETLSPQFERLILFTYPLFVILLGAAFFKHPLRPVALWAFAISYAGLGLVFLTDLHTHGSAIVVGALWCMTSSVAFASYLLLAKPMIARLGASFFTSWAMSGAALAMGVHFFLVHRLSDIHMSKDLLILCIGLAIGATVLPSYLTNFALGRISSQANAVISFINPVFTLIMSAVILRQVISVADVVGTCLVVAGVGLYTWLDKRSARAPGTAQPSLSKG
ncbi:MAG: DMT family transporter [Asticcacaulis sp.]|nr:DMT family transporter [Asticcacaulis sp.]